jgi:hypothetical protein
MVRSVRTVTPLTWTEKTSPSPPPGQCAVYRRSVGTVVFVVLGVIGAVVMFVWLAMDAGRYSWATELVGRSIDRVRSRIRKRQ